MKKLIYSKLCENGQSNIFKFRLLSSSFKQLPSVNVSYSTFWNDFSHYSLYQEDQQITDQKLPIQYDNLNDPQGMFLDKSKFIDYQDISLSSFLKFHQNQQQQRKQEIFELEFESNLKYQNEYSMFAHIPQEFNVDIETNGNILGVNQGDSKFQGLLSRLITSGAESYVKARRIRTDQCQIQTVNGNIEIGSYIESQNLNIKTISGNIKVSKKLGIANFGIIEQGLSLINQFPSFQAGSLFSNMAQLPIQKCIGFGIDNHQSELFELIGQKQERGLLIKNNGTIQIDNVQGILSIDKSTIKQTEYQDIELLNVENGFLNIDAPNSNVVIFLKSLHDSSYVNCQKCTVYVCEDFYQANILDAQNKIQNPIDGRFKPLIDDMDFVLSDVRPSLYINSKLQSEVKVLSNFDFIKTQIQTKILKKKNNK